MITPLIFNNLSFKQNNIQRQQPVLKHSYQTDVCTFSGRPRLAAENEFALPPKPKANNFVLNQVEKIINESYGAYKGSWYSPENKVVITKKIDEYSFLVYKKLLQDGTEIAMSRFKSAPCMFIKIKNEVKNIAENAEIYLEDTIGLNPHEKGEINTFSRGISNEFLQEHLQKFLDAKAETLNPIDNKQMNLFNKKIKLFLAAKQDDYKKATEITGLGEKYCKEWYKPFKEQEFPDFDIMLKPKQKYTKLDPEIQKQIIEFAKDKPDMGYCQMTNALNAMGVKVSSKGVNNTLINNGLERTSFNHGLKDRKAVVRTAPETEKAVVELIKKNPYIKRDQIIDTLAKQNIKISSNGVLGVLERQGLDTIEKRLAFLKENNITVRGIRKLREESLKAVNKKSESEGQQIINFALANPWWGDKKLEEELAKTGVKAFHKTIDSILKRHNLETSPQRIALAEKMGIEIIGNEKAVAFLELVKEVGIGKACEQTGYTRNHYFRYKKLYEEYDHKYIPNGINKTERRKSALAPEKEKAIIEVTAQYPRLGYKSIAKEICLRGVNINPSTVHRYWENKKIIDPNKRLKFAEEINQQNRRKNDYTH